MKTSDLLKRFKKVCPQVLGRYFEDFGVKSGSGCYLYGIDDRTYLDFSSGIATCVTGHCHPDVVDATSEQINKLIHICIGVALYEPYIKLAEELRKIVPIKNAQSFLCQSGSEAVEAAIKLAKYATKRPGVIAFKGGFHGRTLGALSLTTSKMKYRDGYEPLLKNSFIAPYDIKVVEGIIKANKGKIGAAIIEPMQGEGGYIEVPRGFMKALRSICNKNKMLLIVDEVQTGFGHTGKWFAIEHYGVKPDIITLAKGIASGFTLGACVASEELMKKWSPGAHGGTYGGNPVNCAAGVATIDVIKKEKLVQNAKKMGDYLKKGLLEIQKECPIIKDVRGQGLMLGVDFKDANIAKAIMNYCLSQRLVLISTGANGTVIRFVPALIVTKKQIDTCLKIFKDALCKIS